MNIFLDGGVFQLLGMGVLVLCSLGLVWLNSRDGK